MRYNPDIHHRRSVRLKGYDYSSKGMYFITICTQNRENLFGEIVDNEMILNVAGEMVKRWYLELKNKYTNLYCDVNVIMPNHFHCIIEILGTNVGADLRVCPDMNQCHVQGEHTGSGRTHRFRANTQVQGEHTGSPLPQIIQWFKTMTTNGYIKMVKQNLLPCFYKRIWQRNYHEHIIRNEQEYIRIVDYIENNPRLWKDDRYNN